MSTVSISPNAVADLEGLPAEAAESVLDRLEQFESDGSNTADGTAVTFEHGGYLVTADWSNRRNEWVVLSVKEKRD